MVHAFLIFIGGGLGAVARHFSGLLALRFLGAGFPYGTLFVNVLGSLAMGLFIGWLFRSGAEGSNLRLIVATGFLGGFTTFSAFSLDFANLWTRGETALALGYVATSVCLSLLAVFVGLWLMRQVS